MNFELFVLLNLDLKFEINFKLVLVDYVLEFLFFYIDNLFWYCWWFFVVGVMGKINEEYVINYKVILIKSIEYKLGYICVFLLDWYDKEIKGVDKKMVELFNLFKLFGNEKGKVVVLGCFFSGVYLFEE